MNFFLFVLFKRDQINLLFYGQTTCKTKGIIFFEKRIAKILIWWSSTENRCKCWRVSSYQTSYHNKFGKNMVSRARRSNEIGHLQHFSYIYYSYLSYTCYTILYIDTSYVIVSTWYYQQKLAVYYTVLLPRKALHFVHSEKVCLHFLESNPTHPYLARGRNKTP